MGYQICNICNIKKTTDLFFKNNTKRGTTLECKVCYYTARRLKYKPKQYLIEDIEGEVWKPIPNFVGLYAISNKGRVKLIRNNRLHKQYDRGIGKSTGGYRDVMLKKGNFKKNYKVHYLVLLTFVGDRPKNHVIHHKDGLKHNNILENLEYCTQSENRKADFRDGRQSLSGEKNTQSKLTETEVFDVIRKYNSGIKVTSLCNQYNVTQTAIYSILAGRTWNYLTKIR